MSLSGSDQCLVLSETAAKNVESFDSSTLLVFMTEECLRRSVFRQG